MRHLCTTAMYEVEPNYLYLYLRITPADARRPSLRWPLAPCPVLRRDGTTLPVAPPSPRISARWPFDMPSRTVSSSRAKNFKTTRWRFMRGWIPSRADPAARLPSKSGCARRTKMPTRPPANTTMSESWNCRPTASTFWSARESQREPPSPSYIERSDGKLIHYWRPASLTGLVASLGNSDYFADLTAAGDSIGLIAWKSGAVVRKIKTSGHIAAFCGTADGRQILASVDRKKSCQIRSEDRKADRRNDLGPLARGLFARRQRVYRILAKPRAD